MIRPLEVFIGLRYTRAKRRNHYISFISLTSMLGVALGVWALITVISVMNGFEKELRGRILGVASHATVTGLSGSLSRWRETAAEIAGQDHVVAQAPYIKGQGMVTKGRDAHGVLVRGILPDRERKVADIAGKLTQGRLDALKAGKYGIILGSELAFALNAVLGSKVTLITPQGQVSPTGMLPRIKRFTVVGIFEIGMYDYDSALVFIHLSDAAKLYRTGKRVTGLRLKLDDIYAAPQVRRALIKNLRAGYLVRDWTLEHANFFRALRIEKTAMFVILLLIVAVAAFNIVSTLVMMVTDKQSDIAILRTLGLSPARVMGVFMVQGCVIGIIGILVGGIFGVITALNVETIVPFIEGIMGHKFLEADVYYISDLPSDMRWSDVITILSTGLVMSLLATLYPAWRASRTQPADALRYE
ncbi:MAG TPA: lipoprotein-releasing ABC transporter permease subunit [Acidiferrobacteraceae bacterium]|nr:lipoprotein-releasing ABC transporter permease subunit [Acidiferrobacteraceae bacterium]